MAVSGKTHVRRHCGDSPAASPYPFRIGTIYGDAEALSEGLSEFPDWVVHLVCVQNLLSEVHNGGLMQFFINSTGILAPEALTAFRALGLPEAAEALSGAIAVFGASYPRDKRDRYQILRAKAGLTFEDMEIQMWRAKLFLAMEDRLQAVGGPMMRNIYARMNDYAREHTETTA